MADKPAFWWLAKRWFGNGKEAVYTCHSLFSCWSGSRRWRFFGPPRYLVETVRQFCVQTAESADGLDWRRRACQSAPRAATRNRSLCSASDVKRLTRIDDATGEFFYGGVDPQLSPWPLMWCGTKPRRKCALAHRDVIIVVSESLGLGRQLSFTSLGSRPGGVIQILQLGLLHVHNMIQYELKSKLRTTGATP